MKVNSKSNKVNRAWLNDHVNDTYVKLAQLEGYRSRAAYKLKEIDEALHLIQPDQLVVDLGCAPGAWSQYVRRKMSPKTAVGGGTGLSGLNGRIIALDILPMVPLPGVVLLQGDFREAEVLQLLTGEMNGRQADIVVSDMAPNLSGIASVDVANIEALVELAIAFSQQHMKPQGALVAKVFHGAAYDPLIQRFRDVFRVVKTIKPKASRGKSSETFLVGLGLKPV
jgi:23S rRNA (uridine2552-2'-O)-methyltransferase